MGDTIATFLYKINFIFYIIFKKVYLNTGLIFCDNYVMSYEIYSKNNRLGDNPFNNSWIIGHLKLNIRRSNGNLYYSDDMENEYNRYIMLNNKDVLFVKRVKITNLKDYRNKKIDEILG